MRILTFAGTRPEAIKVAPVIKALQNQPHCESLLISSGQHHEMLYQAFADFQLSPDIDLKVMQPNQTLASLSAKLFTAVDSLLLEQKPDWVLVQGDTTTVMTTALCAFYRGIKVGHIEAGLRSFRLDAPFPEELNRRVAGIVAQKHFAPTTTAKENLLREHVAEQDIYVTGNTVIDALLWMRQHGGATKDILPSPILTALDQGKRLILVTGHRRENFGEGFLEICKALKMIAENHSDAYIVYPVHLNPQVSGPVNEILQGQERILLIPPLQYKSFIALMDVATLILTDSGGVQEEGPALGKPVLVMREITERPEGIAAGTAKLVGAKAQRIVEGVHTLLSDDEAYAQMAQAINPYGDGQAAQRIVQTLFHS